MEKPKILTIKELYDQLDEIITETVMNHDLHGQVYAELGFAGVGVTGLLYDPGPGHLIVQCVHVKEEDW